MALIELDFGSFEGQPVRELMIKNARTTRRGWSTCCPRMRAVGRCRLARPALSVRTWLERHPEDEICSSA